MAELLKGSKVIEDLSLKLKSEVESFKTKPTLAILGVGENPSDMSYKRGILKKASEIGINVKEVILDINVSQEDFDLELNKLNKDKDINGILMFRPLPKTLDEEKARNMIAPQKDIDGCSDLSLAGIFTNTKLGFPPCTAEACMKILSYYDIPLSGKNVCVIGRSLVIGKPVSMMALNENATVTICNSKTKDLPSIARKADILISCIGKLSYITKDFVNSNQVIIDVGINWDEKIGKISGDVKFDEVEPLCKMITPVPGGVGGVTSLILISHTIDAYKEMNK